jgi:hypothetical protein
VKGKGNDLALCAVVCLSRLFSVLTIKKVKKSFFFFFCVSLPIPLKLHVEGIGSFVYFCLFVFSYSVSFPIIKCIGFWLPGA